MKETFIKKIGLFVLALILVQASYAQVTIGSGLVPNAGALLDLKQETDGFSDKGLGMPRVQLQDINKLQMGATAIEHTDKVAHTGLMVYNVSRATLPQCAPIPNGLYVWDGAKWNGVGIKEIAPPNLNLGSKIYFDLPSGKDERGAITAQSFNVAWSPAQPLPYTKTATSFGDVSFTTAPLVVSPLATSPTVFSMTPDAMTIADPTNPWQSKESVLAFTAVDECGGIFAETITLNQTNYAMKVNNSVEDSNILLKDISPKSFDVRTNNIWKVTVTDPKGVLAATAPLIGGADNTTSGNSSTTFTYTASAGGTGTGTKYQTATLKFEDAHTTKRAKDITVTTMQCQGTPDLSGLLTATPAETSGANIWGTNVIRHLAKAGVYEEFLSANFGTAGRWMTTNLSASAYDGITHSVGRALSGPNGNLGNPYTTAYWAYPKADAAVVVGEIASNEWKENKHIGFLYTWDAATAGKGGANGDLNIDNISGAGADNDESAFPQGTGPGQQQKRQGICPAGWHLPSDRQFTDLENYIKNYTTQHSTMPNNLGTVSNNTQHGNATSPTIPLGTAMKDACANGINASKSATEGGFNLQLVGTAHSAKTISYGTIIALWSSSSAPSSSVTSAGWYRITTNNDTAMNRLIANRNNMFSVRCTKD